MADDIDRPVSFLLTGATGFIGSRLARRLIQAGYDVHIVVRPASKLEPLADLQNYGNVRLHRYDGTTESLLQLFDAAPIDIVVHLASLSSVTHSLANFDAMLQSNIIFGAQLAEAMAENGIRYFINTGSYSQHYNNEDYNPQSLYAATKQAYEDILVYYSEAASLSCLTLELFDSYGPNDPRPKIVPLLLKAYQTGKELALSPGWQMLDLVYVEDIVDAYVATANRLLAGKAPKKERYTVASGRPLTLRELVSKLETVLQSKLPVQWGAHAYRNREMMRPWSGGIALPGWQPATPIEQGLEQCVRAARAIK